MAWDISCERPSEAELLRWQRLDNLSPGRKQAGALSSALDAVTEEERRRGKSLRGVEWDSFFDSEYLRGGGDPAWLGSLTKENRRVLRHRGRKKVLSAS